MAEVTGPEVLVAAPPPPPSPIKPNLDAKALVPVGPVQTIKEAAYKPKVFGKDVNTGKPVEVEFLDENDPRGKFRKAPEKPRPPKKESPQPKTERQKPPEPEPQTPPLEEKPRETRARRTIRRHEPVTKKNARAVLEYLAAKTSTPPQETSPAKSTPEPQPSETQPKPPESTPPQTEPPPLTPTEPEATQAAPSPQPEVAKDTNAERRAEVDALLTEASKLLFDIKDVRVALTALARQAAGTPLGNEFRDRVLGMIQEIDLSKLPADQQQARQALDALKQKMIDIRPLPQPETKPQDTELYKLLKTMPASEQIGALLQGLESGMANPAIVGEVLQNPNFKNIASTLQKELFGAAALPQNTEKFLKAAGLDVNKKNLKQMEGILNPKHKITLGEIGSSLFLTLIVVSTLSQFTSQLLAENERESR